MATFRLPLIQHTLLQQLDPQAAADYEKTPEYIGAKTAKDQEHLTQTGALGLAGALVGGGAAGIFGGSAAAAGGAGAAGAGVSAGTAAAIEAGVGAGAGTAALAGGAAAVGATLMPPAVVDSAAIGSMTAAEGGAASSSLSTLGGVKDAATILSPAASLLASASMNNAAKGIGNIAPPGVRPTVPMPIFGSGSSENMRASYEQQLRRRGRASTILTDSQPETLGA